SVAVCIWDKISLKESPSDKGKWLASLSLGEKCTYLDDSKEDNSGKKPVTYYKVKLQDNQEGWVQSDFVILKSKPATIIKEAEIYSRPDLLTKSNKTFSMMDIVAVKSEQGDFIEIVGKRKAGKWIESGWVKSSTVSYADVDIAVAKYGGKALEIPDRQKRNSALNEIINNQDFKSSVFINTLFKMVDDSISSPEPAKVED
ncbi:MAG TPA: SH3 domain-containing protein, partial [Bacteroidales bacterium]